jgi:hypothetical protein
VQPNKLWVKLKFVVFKWAYSGILRFPITGILILQTKEALNFALFILGLARKKENWDPNILLLNFFFDLLNTVFTFFFPFV